jgi:hypothetical protein
MTLMVAGVACLAVSSVWHVGLAVLSAREASRRAAGTRTTSDHVARSDGAGAAPSVLWLVLVNPAPEALAAVRAVGLRLRCRTRTVVVVSDPAQHERPDHADTHRLTVPPGLDRAEVLNRAYRLIRTWCREYGEDPARTVVGILDAGALPEDGLAVAVWQAFQDPRVGGVQARVQVVGAGGLSAADQYERGVLADAANLVRSRRGRARLGVTGAFVRLSELARLGSRPWRSGVVEDYGLTVRLRRLGVQLRHCPDIRIAVPTPDQNTVVRQHTRAAQGRLRAWPSPTHGRQRREWLSWALRVAGWPLPGLVALWVVAAFAAAGTRQLLTAPQPPAEAPRWAELLWTVMAMDTPSWAALVRAAALWVGVAVAPVVAWWIARRDLALGALLRGAVARPLVLLARPVAFGLALVRALFRRTGDPIGEPVTRTPRSHRASSGVEPVFVDVTGRRRRRVWTVAYGLSMAGIAYVAAFGIALASQHVFPHSNLGYRPEIPVPAPQPTATAEEPAGAGAGGSDDWIGGAGAAPAAPISQPASPTPTESPIPTEEPSPSEEPTEPADPSPTEPEEPLVPTDPPADPPGGGDGAGLLDQLTDSILGGLV